ncbi:MAG: hypothetical protein K2G31_06195 [Clostridia bacterium]|nr:hypothetical protein [Clostridia bacterium]
MIKLSSLLGSPVLCLASSCISGSVADVYFDEYCKKAVYFCIHPTNLPHKFTPQTEAFVGTPRKRFHGDPDVNPTNRGVCGDPGIADRNSLLLLPIEDASSVSDAVVIADEVPFISPADVDLTAMHSGLKDMAVYTQSGAFKGAISNVLFTNAGKVVKLILPEGEFTPQAILSASEVMILKSAVKGKPTVRKRTIPRPEKDYPVQILNDKKATVALNTEKPATALNVQSAMPAAMPSAEQSQYAKPAATQHAGTTIAYTATPIATNSAVEVPTKPAVALSTDKREPVLSNGAFKIILDGSEAYSYDDDAHTPTRVICDYEFLLGRTLGADLRTYSGELIANEGCVVTDMIVDKARRAGKLVELTLNSVKPTAKN